MRKVPFAIASRLEAIPLLLRGGRLIVALEDPSRREVIEEIEFSAQCKVVPTLAAAGHIARLLAPIYEKFGSDLWTRLAQDTAGGGHEFDAVDASKLVESLEPLVPRTP